MPVAVVFSHRRSLLRKRNIWLMHDLSGFGTLVVVVGEGVQSGISCILPQACS